MMNEEKYLKERVGKENPFRVPTGYFDTLADQVMAGIDANMPAATVKKSARQVWLRPAYLVAASVCAMMISTAAYLSFKPTSSDSSEQALAVSQYVGDEFDEAADYVMVDNDEIYACLMSDY